MTERTEGKTSFDAVFSKKLPELDTDMLQFVQDSVWKDGQFRFVVQYFTRRVG